jgi:hypothetical protein
LHDGIRPHVRAAGDAVLTGDRNARARTVKGESVIATHQLLAHDRAERQRITAMRTPVGQRHHLARFTSEKCNVLTEDLAGKWL